MSKESAMAAISNGAVSQPIPSGSAVTGEIPTDAGNQTPQEIAGLDSDRFAALAKREAKVVKEQQEWKARIAKERAEVEELKAKLKDPYDRIQSFEELRKTDPVAALKQIGFSETDIFNFMAQAEAPKEPTPGEIAAKAAQDEISKFKEEQAKALTEAQKAKDEALVTKFYKEVEEVVTQNKDTYEYIAFHGAKGQNEIKEFINEIVNSDIPLPPLKDILDAVETAMEEEDKKRMTIKKRATWGAEPVPGKEEPLRAEVKPHTTERTRTVIPAKEASPTAKTLTNKVAPTSSSIAQRKETPDQKRARLIEALRSGKL